MNGILGIGLIVVLWAILVKLPPHDDPPGSNQD